MGRNYVRDVGIERLWFGGFIVSCLRRGLGKMEREREREREREQRNKQ